MKDWYLRKHEYVSYGRKEGPRMKLGWWLGKASVTSRCLSAIKMLRGILNLIPPQPSNSFICSASDGTTISALSYLGSLTRSPWTITYLCIGHKSPSQTSSGFRYCPGSIEAVNLPSIPAPSPRRRKICITNLTGIWQCSPVLHSP